MKTTQVLGWLAEGKEVHVRFPQRDWESFPGKCSNRFICDVMRGECRENILFRLAPVETLALTTGEFLKSFDIDIESGHGGAATITIGLFVQGSRIAELADSLDRWSRTQNQR